MYFKQKKNLFTYLLHEFKMNCLGIQYLYIVGINYDFILK